MDTRCWPKHAGSPRHYWPKTRGPRHVAQDIGGPRHAAQDTGGPRHAAQDTGGHPLQQCCAALRGCAAKGRIFSPPRVPRNLPRKGRPGEGRPAPRKIAKTPKKSHGSVGNIFLTLRKTGVSRIFVGTPSPTRKGPPPLPVKKKKVKKVKIEKGHNRSKLKLTALKIAYK